MNSMKRLILISLITIPSIQANYFGNFLFNRGRTTDNIDYNEAYIEADTNKRDLIWPYQNETLEPDNFGLSYYHRYQKGPLFKFNYQEIIGRYDYQFHEKHKLKTSFGVYHIDEEGHGEKTTKFTGKLNLVSNYSRNLNTRIEIGRGIELRHIFLLQGSLQNLTATTLGLRGQYMFLQDWLVTNIIVQKSYLTNDNVRNFYDAELMVNFMTWPHWIRLGWGYHELMYDKTSASYWSPEDFYAHGPRVDLSFTLFDPLQYYLGGSYNWFEENKRFQGSGYYMRTGLRYGIREDYIIDFSYERNESIQNSRSWVNDAYALNLNRFF